MGLRDEISRGVAVSLPSIYIDDLPRAWEAEKQAGPRKTPAFGAGIAAREFVHALLAFGNAESVIFAYGDRRRLSDSEALLHELPYKERISLLPYAEIQQLYDREQLVLLSLHSRLHEMVHLRAQRDQPLWITAGITHSLSHRAGVALGLYTLLQGMRPYDILACTSTAGREAVRKLLCHLSKSLFERLGQHVVGNFRLPVVPLGVDEHTYTPGDQGGARRILDLSSSRTMFLCLSRFSLETKLDPFPLLTAFREAFPEFATRPILVFAGDDTEYKLANAIESYATKLGLSNDVVIRTDIGLTDKVRLYQAADVFVSPADNLQETFGCTILEAMSCGLPVIATDWSGYRDLVIDGTTGFLLPTLWGNCWDSWLPSAPLGRDREYQGRIAQTVSFNMATAVARFRDLAWSVELRARMARKSRNRVLQEFTWRSVVRQHEELWKESLAMAESSPPRVGTGSLLAYHPIHVFGHYPTSVLEKHCAIAITPIGRRALSGEFDWRPDRVEMLAPEYAAALEVLTKLQGINHLTLLGLWEGASDAIAKDATTRSVLHLAKYGLVEIVTEESTKKGDGSSEEPS